LAIYQYNEIKQALKEAKNILIVSHKNPDGDAIGSVLGLYHYLKKSINTIQLTTPDEKPFFLKWMPNSEKVLSYESNKNEINEDIKKADVIFCLDFNALHRIEEMGEQIKLSKAIKINIDHHQEPEMFQDYSVWDTEIASTCELIYGLIDFLGGTNAFDKDIATCLYTGIVTDTGSFKFPSTTAKTHAIASHLLAQGINHYDIHSSIFDNNKESRLRLVGYALSEKLKVLYDFNTAYMSLSSEELKRFNFKKGDSEGLVNYGLSIENMRFAALFTEFDEGVKISFRSKGSFDVNSFSRLHFNGGGHVHAAGGKLKMSISEALAYFEDTLSKYKSELNS